MGKYCILIYNIAKCKLERVIETYLGGVAKTLSFSVGSSTNLQ